MKQISLLLLLVVLACGSVWGEEKKITWEKDGTKMVFIPATEFLMGTKASTLDEIIFFSLYQIFNLILNE